MRIGFNTRACWFRRRLGPDGQHFCGALTTHNYDCAVIDMGPPDTTGDILLRDVRRQDANLPVMVVIARSGVRERIAMLDQGADDSLVEPFDLGNSFA